MGRNTCLCCFVLSLRYFYATIVRLECSGKRFRVQEQARRQNASHHIFIRSYRCARSPGPSLYFITNTRPMWWSLTKHSTISPSRPPSAIDHRKNCSLETNRDSPHHKRHAVCTTAGAKLKISMPPSDMFCVGGMFFSGRTTRFVSYTCRICRQSPV